MWYLTLIDKKGLSCYTAVNDVMIIDSGETINVVADTGELWLSKDNIQIWNDNHIYWQTSNMEVYIEKE
jgi:hypothetical protein